MSKVAIRYAKAVLESSKTSAEAVNTDMITIQKAIASSKELQLFLKNPVIKPEIKQKALLEVFSEVQEPVQKLFALLQANKRFELLPEIAIQYQEVFNEANGIQAATVITAAPITAAIQAKVLSVAQSMTTKSIKIENIIDPSIIGGFILRIGDKQYNASVKNNLQIIKQEFGS